MNTAKAQGRGNKFPEAMSEASVCDSDAKEGRETK